MLMMRPLVYRRQVHKVTMKATVNQVTAVHEGEFQVSDMEHVADNWNWLQQSTIFYTKNQMILKLDEPESCQ